MFSLLPPWLRFYFHYSAFGVRQSAKKRRNEDRATSSNQTMQLTATRTAFTFFYD
jgi:hypothetical protein